MLNKLTNKSLLSIIGKPIQVYLDLTIAEPCKAIAESSKERAKTSPKKRQNNFSLRNHIKKQKEMTSPEVANFVSVNSNLHKMYVAQQSPFKGSEVSTPRILH